MTTCADLTATLNTALQASIDAYTTNLVDLFLPLQLSRSENPFELHSDPACVADTDADGLDECTAGATSAASVATNHVGDSTSCDVIVPGTLNASYADPNVPSDPCFSTFGAAARVRFAGCDLDLVDARMAAEHDAPPRPDRLTTGVLVGFLTEAEAMTCSVTVTNGCPSSQTLHQMLDASDGCGVGADRDVHGGVQGWWLYFDVTAERVEWN